MHITARVKPLENSGTYAFLLFVTYSLILPVILYFLTKDELGIYLVDMPEPWLRLGLAVLHLHICLRLSYLSVASEASWMRFPFFAFLYIWVTVTPPIQFSEGSYPWGVYLGEGEYLYSLAIIAVGVLSYEAGVASVKKPALYIWNLPRPSYSVFRIQALAIIGCVLVIVFAVIVGPDKLIGTRSEAGAALAEIGEGPTRLILRAVLRSPSLVATFALFCLAFTGAWRRTPHFWLLMLMSLSFFLLANFPTAVQRAWIGGIGLGFLALFALSKKANIYRTMGLPIILSFLFVFPSFKKVDLDRLFSPRAFVYGDYDVFQMNSIIVNFTNERGIEWGRQFLGPLLFWLPRSLWENKPVGTGYYVAEETMMRFSNVSAPLWSEAYINFGIVGTIVLFFLYGRISRRWEVKLASGTISLKLAVLASFISGFQVFVLRGDLMTSATHLLPVILVASVALRAPSSRNLARLRSPQSYYGGA